MYDNNHVKSSLKGFFIAFFAGLGLFLGSVNTASAVDPEIVIGEVRIEPGIIMIFEAARRDDIHPGPQHLNSDKTDIHIEARANWAIAAEGQGSVPPGAPEGGFVAYLNVHAEVINETTGDRTYVTLVPMLNLVDNYHYARNIQVPGSCEDRYTVKFFVNPPDRFSLATHPDWRNEVGKKLFAFGQPKRFTYEKVDFSLNCGIDRGA